MLRLIGGVIVGYLVMAVFIFATFSAAFVLMGVDGAYRPGTFDISMLWILISFVLGLAGAILGGLVCAAIARHPKAVPTLIVLVLALGLLSAIPVMMASDSGPDERSGEVGVLEAMQSSRQPVWVALVNPLLGAAGVFIGGRRRSGA